MWAVIPEPTWAGMPVDCGQCTVAGCWPAEYLLLRGIRRQGFFPLAHRFTFEFQPMGSAQEAIQKGISHSWIIAQVSMPMCNRQLTGNECRTPAVAIID